jgi:hypothetical protein
MFHSFPSDCLAGALIGNTTPVSTPGIENLQMAVSTNGAGTILSAGLAVSQEFDTLPGFTDFAHPDSFNGMGAWASGIRCVVKAGGSPDVQVDKKNPFPIVIYGAAGFDVTTIDDSSLLIGFGGITHSNAHISDTDGDKEMDKVAHFESSESELRCGNNLVKLSGTSDGVPFVCAVEVNGIGKHCR